MTRLRATGGRRIGPRAWQLDDTGVHTVTDGAHRSNPHFDVTQLATFKFADDGSTHPTHAIGTSVQSTPADDDHHDPEINLASNAKNHLLQQADDDGTMIDGAHPAHPHSDVTQLANFKFADHGSAHPGTVVPHDSPIVTATISTCRSCPGRSPSAARSIISSGHPNGRLASKIVSAMGKLDFDRGGRILLRHF
jgi:hypothetical protein